jgi:hypothetical protein
MTTPELLDCDRSFESLIEELVRHPHLDDVLARSPELERAVLLLLMRLRSHALYGPLFDRLAGHA